MLNLKLQYFGHLVQRTDSLEKTLMLGKIEGMRRRGQHWMTWFPLGWTGLILLSKGLSKVISNTTVQKHQFFGAQLSL